MSAERAQLMPEIVADGNPFEMPQGPANEFYARKTDPGSGAFVLATLISGPA